MIRCDICNVNGKETSRIRIWSQWKTSHGIRLGIIGKKRVRYLNVCEHCLLNTEPLKPKGSKP